MTYLNQLAHCGHCYMVWNILLVHWHIQTPNMHERLHAWQQESHLENMISMSAFITVLLLMSLQSLHNFENWRWVAESTWGWSLENPLKCQGCAYMTVKHWSCKCKRHKFLPGCWSSPLSALLAQTWRTWRRCWKDPLLHGHQEGVQQKMLVYCLTWNLQVWPIVWITSYTNSNWQMQAKS